MVELGQRIAALKPEQRAIFEAKLKEAGIKRSSSTSIPRRATGARCPLSFGQESLWLFHQMAPDAGVHNISNAYRMKGPLDVVVLWRAANEIVRRHEALRTTIQSVDGYPHQVVSPQLQVAPRTIDLSSLSALERDAEAQRISVREARQPFDLVEGPVFRFLLLKLAGDEYQFIVTIHHIFTDWWSVGAVERELGLLYDAFIAGRPSPLPELPIQFGDYAVWQRERLTGEAFDRQLKYWTRQLAGAPEVCEVLPDRPRTQLRSFRGGRRHFKLVNAPLAGLRALGQQEHTSMFMTLLAAFDVLLHRYTGQSDILVGSPIANRTHKETQGLIGYFMNIQVLRTDLTGDPSFRSLLKRVRRMALDAYAHPDLTYGRITQELRSTPHLSHNPLFQIMFILLVPMAPETPLPGLTRPGWMIDNGTEEFDLNLALWEGPESLYGRIEYNADLYDATTIDRMAAHYEQLLIGIVSNPDERISRLPIQSDSERRQVVVDWNATTKAESPERCVLRAFREQVVRTPDAIAVVCRDQELTYRQLDERSERVAEHLHSLGVTSEVLVGICQERSIEMLVSLLGVIKAGGAYLPLEPSLPRERIEFMLQDASPTVVLTQEKFKNTLSAFNGNVVCIDAHEPTRKRRSKARLPTSNHLQMSRLAYAIYTSGSTGKPKGVLISHRSLANTLSAMQRMPALSAEDTFLAVTSLSFDIATLELFLPLVVGARLIIATQEQSSDGRELARLLSGSGASVMQATPATWRMLVQADWDGDQQLKALCGGEALPPDLARELRRRCGSLWNLYGPTETTIWSSVARIEHDEGPVTIGGPIANTQFYVLDEQLQAVPIGVPGELYIGGLSVGRGYLNRPHLTAERFIPDPFGKEPGARLYKTGDRVRWRVDGHLEFHGRLDHQVKIRGFRIELGEVEAVLTEHPGIRESVAVAHADTSGEQRLVGYLVPQGTAPSASEVRDHLRTRLPDYMIPSAFVFLERLPLNPNGKVDRRALPAPDMNQMSQAATYVAPRGHREEVLAGIWAEVLGVGQVGVHDDFFELGGHSLLATKAVSRIRNAFNVDPPLISLFQAPTVARFAARLETLADNKQLSLRAPSGIRRRTAADLLDRVDKMSDAEVDSLLKQMKEEGLGS